MRTALGLIFFLGALVLLVVELIVLADPGGLTPSSGVGSFAAPWYVHAGWFMVIGAMGWMAMRLLRDGLGRLVRGRGFTPAAR
ncbi:MAG TPA: hypothetical protein VGC13_13980 [Longimicrobium sp.]|jgi:hypothetical protein|uniref:hypothetical protein n=1 Tax=Longimicrobium sp. TaxID=2029185 RepID=UPI002ED7813A